MTTTPPTSYLGSGAKAADVCKSVELGPAATAKLTDAQTVKEFVELLLHEELFPDAMQVLGHWLPKPRAVWWACLSIRKVSSPSELKPLQAPLLAAEKWVADPTDANRRAAGAAAEAQQYRTSAALAAMGAFHTGSLGPPGQPVVPPAEGVTGRVTGAAVTIAALASKPELAAEKYRSFAALAFELGEPKVRTTTTPSQIQRSRGHSRIFRAEEVPDVTRRPPK